jgi:hypothetical protein
MAELSVLDQADAGAFLSRLLRLDPAAPVRCRAVTARRAAMWGRLPWGVLVTRTVAAIDALDITVSAAELLAGLGVAGAPARRDHAWRWSLPPLASRPIESIPVTEIRQIAAAAARTLREVAAAGVGGRVAGERAVRDALLEHVAIEVTGARGEHVQVRQRLIQAVTAMGFLGPADQPAESPEPTVGVRLAGRWVGLAAPFGTAWLPPADLPLRVQRSGH